MKNAIPQPLHTATAHRINKAWNEGNSAQGEIPATGEVTWNQNRFNQENWTVPGAEGSGDRVAFPGNSGTLSRQPGAINHWNITPAFNQWIDGTKPNHGVLLRPEWDDGYPEFRYHSDDAPNGDDRPILRVVVDCVYHVPTSDKEIEFLGIDKDDNNDGVIFDKEPSTWVSGETVQMTWTLTTTAGEGAYGFGQYLRAWIDLDSDCEFQISDSVNFPSNEEVNLEGLNDESYPYVILETFQTACEDIGTQVDTYFVPESDGVRHHTFTYKFKVPDINISGELYTKFRVLLRWSGWPPNDPQLDADDTQFDYDFEGDDNTACGTRWGDVEDYSVTIVSQ